MWNDRLRFAERVAEDWRALSAEEREVALAALQRLDDDPIAGAPLFAPFRGVWSMRMGTVRILYRLAPEARAVFVLMIEREE